MSEWPLAGTDRKKSLSFFGSEAVQAKRADACTPRSSLVAPLLTTGTDAELLNDETGTQDQIHDWLFRASHSVSTPAVSGAHVGIPHQSAARLE